MSSSAFPLNSLLDRGNLFSQTPANSAFTPANPKTSGLFNTDKFITTGNHQQSDGFKVFNAILQKAYQHLASNSASAFTPSYAAKPNNATSSNSNTQTFSPSRVAQYGSPADISTDKISSQQAADTILNFISQRIESDAAAGASEDELLERLDQGLSGFISGFNQAKDQIEALGLLTPSLSDEINDTYERVTSGIEQLRESIIGDSDTENDLEIDDDLNNNLNTALNASNLNRVRLASQTSESSSFSLSLVTQDGDQVTIDISRASQSSFSAAFDRNGNSSSLNVNQQSASSSSFQLNVTGELDEDELTAINQLLQDVDAIATDFFDGRFDEAFALALELDIDREELSSLNLQLQKTTTRRALASYQSTAQNDVPSVGDTPSTSPFEELNQLLDSLENILQEARKFSSPLQLVDDLTNGVNQLSEQESGQRLNSDLADRINTLVSLFDL